MPLSLITKIPGKKFIGEYSISIAGKKLIQDRVEFSSLFYEHNFIALKFIFFRSEETDFIFREGGSNL